MASAARRPRRNPIARKIERAGLVFLLPAMAVISASSSSARSSSPSTSACTTSNCCRTRRHLARSSPIPAIPGSGSTTTATSSATTTSGTAFRNTTWYALGVVPAQTIDRAHPRGPGQSQDPRQDLLPDRLLLPLDQLLRRDLDHLPLDVLRARLRQLRAARARLPDAAAGLAGQPQGRLRDRSSARSASTTCRRWLEGPSVALLSIMMLNVWTTTGTMMVIFLAGLAEHPGRCLRGGRAGRRHPLPAVPRHHRAAAEAGHGFVVTIGLIGTFQVFDQIWVMSEGGPAEDDDDARLPGLRRGFPAGTRTRLCLGDRRDPLLLSSRRST